MQVCSSLHLVRVYVRRVIHVVDHNALTDVGSVLEVVHTFPWPFVILYLFVNFWFKRYYIYTSREALLYVFEDNEAVIKMIMKGRSPTMRHVSRTHRVALDWLFDRINLDPKIQIKYIDTKNQLADILTKGNFTRDEWNHLYELNKNQEMDVSQPNHDL